MRWMTPEAFWSAHPIEIWWHIEANQPVKMYGKLTEHDVNEIIEDLKSG